MQEKERDQEEGNEVIKDLKGDGYARKQSYLPPFFRTVRWLRVVLCRQFRVGSSQRSRCLHWTWTSGTLLGGCRTEWSTVRWMSKSR